MAWLYFRNRMNYHKSKFFRSDYLVGNKKSITFAPYFDVYVS